MERALSIPADSHTFHRLPMSRIIYMHLVLNVISLRAVFFNYFGYLSIML